MLIRFPGNEPFREPGRFLLDATSGNAHFLTEKTLCSPGIATMTKGEPLVTERLRATEGLRAPDVSQVWRRPEREESF